MENKTRSSAEIEAILTSLDGITKAEAPPFFHTRLSARLQRNAVIPSSQHWGFAFLRPSLVTLCLFLVLNVLSIRAVILEKQTSIEGNTTSEANLQSFSQEYNLGVTLPYNETSTTNKAINHE